MHRVSFSIAAMDTLCLETACILTIFRSEFAKQNGIRLQCFSLEHKHNQELTVGK